MGPIGHTVAASAAGGAVYLATSCSAAGAATLGVGVLLDPDHLYDHHQWHMKGKKCSISGSTHGSILAQYGVPTVVAQASLIRVSRAEATPSTAYDGPPPIRTVPKPRKSLLDSHGPSGSNRKTLPVPGFV